MEKNCHEVLTDKLGIHFFELKKIGKHPNKNNLMEMWLQLIAAETEEELSMPENKNVQDDTGGIVVMRDLTPDEYKEYLSEMREKRLHDEASALAYARSKGFAEGFAEGFTESYEKIFASILADGFEGSFLSLFVKTFKESYEEVFSKEYSNDFDHALPIAIKEVKIRLAESFRKMEIPEEQIKKSLEM